jgi:pyruvate dehydrogenase E2 component (dihydrolipoamide acetyltransferase)
MRQEILMPALAADMTEGNLVRWLKGVGDIVAAGDALAEVETDKATVEVPAPSAGRLHEILVLAGTEGVAVDTPMAVLVDVDSPGDTTESVRAEATPEEAIQGPVASAPRVFASPIARRLANEADLELRSITGSGPGGRIVKVDIQAFVKPEARTSSHDSQEFAGNHGVAAAVTDIRPDDKTGRYTVRPNSTMRRSIARRLTGAKQTIPHFYLSIECDVCELLTLRATLNGFAKEIKLSVNDFAVYAAALALTEVPAANASWTDAAILQYERADISVAVSTERGLVTPIVKDMGRKTLVNTALEIRDLTARARAGKLKAEEYSGGTFTVTNLGMFGVREFAAIINPPQACILALGAAQQRPVVRDGSLAISTLMTCTLSVDHRVIDGAVAAQFLAAFKMHVETPLGMLL